MSKLSDSVGVAVIGAGYWGRKLVQEYLLAEANGSLALRRVCDESLPALGALLISKGTEKLDPALLTQNLNDVLTDDTISAVHIATPNSTHYGIVRKALEADKHVLIEKPMCTRSEECYELVDLAKSRELVLQVGHIYRYNAALHTARSVLNDHRLGKIYYVRIQWTDQGYFRDRDIIFDLGPHPIDILNQLLDAWPTHLEGIARAFRNGSDQYEVAYVMAELPDNMFAHIELSWLHPGKAREVIIVGSNGALTVDCLNQRVFHRSSDATVELPVVVNNTIASEIEHFIDAIVCDDFSSDEGLVGARTVKTLEQIRAAIQAQPSEVGIDDWPHPRKINAGMVEAKLVEAETKIDAANLEEINVAEAEPSKNSGLN